MPRIAWSTFLKNHPASRHHLVVAVVPIDTDLAALAAVIRELPFLGNVPSRT